MIRLVAVMMVLAALPVAAQTGESPPARRVEVDAGGGWLAGAGFGSSDANLRAAAAAPAAFRLFSVESRLAAAPTFHIRTGFAFNRRIGVEGALTISRPELNASVSNDAEGAAPIAIAERVDQYGIDAGIVVMIRELPLGGRTLPFVAAGAGYLRQLHEGRTVVEEGHFFHAGGGVKHWAMVRNRGLITGVGLRADARLYITSGGIEFEDDPRSHGAISGSVFLTF